METTLSFHVKLHPLAAHRSQRHKGSARVSRRVNAVMLAAPLRQHEKRRLSANFARRQSRVERV